jgi:hypothetical protein
LNLGIFGSKFLKAQKSLRNSKEFSRLKKDIKEDDNNHEFKDVMSGQFE